MSLVAFFDLEVNPETQKILDIGAIKSDDDLYHKNHVRDFIQFVIDADFLCGHNIFAHDLKYLQKAIGDPEFGLDKAIDTLLLSPLLFPRNPYHRLVKDDKLQTDERSNPVNDAKKARDLFYDEIKAFAELKENVKKIFFRLLHRQQQFRNFFKFIHFSADESDDLVNLIRSTFKNSICDHCDIASLIRDNPIELAYTLAILNCNDRDSLTPAWVLRNHPRVEQIFFLLRNNPCVSGCEYCKKSLNPYAALKRHFGYDSFRTYGGEALQENAVNAAIQNKSLLAVFPTGGGKSITFQIPALMSGENAKALTVVISPLQSLMKDQVDNLEKKDILEAVTINGLLDPIERQKSIERVESGRTSLLYISPESLRSVTIERLLLKRKIARFVIDEAHCFSSWGQDFRVDYLYIGDFIKNLQQQKNLEYPIPISCFTATAKQKVIEDIQKYFQEKLNLQLEIFEASSSRRPNLHYQVFQNEDEERKYDQLRSIIENKNCPSIVYVARTKRAHELAERLTKDGYPAKPFHGKMEKKEKTSNQDAFMKGEVNIIVATSAFGMGVDKSDVGTVVHYDISDSLENYTQESGRAGRDEKISAECYVLFNEADLDKHFIMLNQTKISVKEINQVWRAIKDLTRTRLKASNSALEIARKAGWDDSIADIETRIKTAIAALEEAGYIKRGQNMPRLYANSILMKSAQEAISKINASEKFAEEQKDNAARIIKKLFSSKSKRLSTDEDAESRVDYISDQLGIAKDEVIRIIELMREEKILADAKDLSAFIKRGESSNRSLSIVEAYRKIEDFLLSQFQEYESSYHFKELNEKCIVEGIDESSINKLKTIINFWTIKNWIKRQNLDYSKHHINVAIVPKKVEFKNKIQKKHILARLITEYLHERSIEIKSKDETREEVLIEFSVQELKKMVLEKQGLFKDSVTNDEIEDCLFYLSRIEAIKIEGGFLVVYNKLSIDRLEQNTRIQYKESDYTKLAVHYQQKVQQIHIVGEYAKKMIRNYNEALQFVDDYFSLNYSSFLNKYFPGSRQDEINRTLTPEKFEKLFGELSPSQLEIIKDSHNQYIVVAAGPGSGKTRVLVHKLASLLLTEDVKHEQLLMLTFSRAAATEFKKQLLNLIGNAANFIDIKTFHAYCFDLMGKMGSLTDADTILKTTIEKIRSGDIEKNRITKTVLVVDEAQDMSATEYELVKVLAEQNDEMRIIFVGDDDQNIYSFRRSDSKYMQQLIVENAAIKYELVENYRSKSNIVSFFNQWAQKISKRLKKFPIIPVQKDNGSIHIVQYESDHLIIPLAEKVTRTDLRGSTCILTRTNEEAVQISSLLRQKGLSTKLIQTNDGFPFSQLSEIKFLSALLCDHSDSPLIGDDDWNSALELFSRTFSQSSKLEIASQAARQFALTNPVKKYKTDWTTFVSESKIEDFTQIDNETIFVSTIHKAKGKEFENVILLLNGFDVSSDDQKRQLYVAMTRAKSNLFIHYNGNYLDTTRAENCSYELDKSEYGEAKEVTLLLGHKDVQLGYFKFVKHHVEKLFSGIVLSIVGDGIANTSGEKVLGYSRAFKDKLIPWLNKGYKVKSAKVNFIVYWRDEEINEEVRIVLPEILLTKNDI